MAYPSFAASSPQFRSVGTEGEYEVIHDRVVIRAAPSTKAAIVAVSALGDIWSGSPFEIERLPWLRLAQCSLEEHHIKVPPNVEGCWMLTDGHSVGLGQLLRTRPGPGASAIPGTKSQPSRTSSSVAVPEVKAEPSGPCDEFIVVHEKVVRRNGPSLDAAPLQIHQRGAIFKGVPHNCSEQPWLHVDNEGGWVLMDGACIGLGRLLERAADITEDVLLWAQQQRFGSSESAKQGHWTTEAEQELLRVEATTRRQVSPLRNWCVHNAVLEELERAGLLSPLDRTLGPAGIATRILRLLLGCRLGNLVLAEQPLQNGLPWSEHSFDQFLVEKIEPLAPFYCRILEPDEPPQRILVLLHGSLVPGDGLVPEAETLRKFMPETAIVLPEAPVVADEALGLLVWWPLPERRPIEEVMDARRARELGLLRAPAGTLQRLVATVTWVGARFKGVPLILGGFSQGAMLVAQALASIRSDVRPLGLVILSGLVEGFKVPHGVKCLAIHGDRDERVELALAREVATLDCTNIADFDFEVVPEMGHEISDFVVDRVVDFCDRVKPIERFLAKQSDSDWAQELHRTKMMRWVKHISSVITMFDAPSFLSHMMVLDMKGLDKSCPALGNGQIRYVLHDAGRESRGLVILFHGKVRDLHQDTSALSAAYGKFCLSVCVVDYRQKFSQFCVDATIVLEELEAISSEMSSPVIIHASGCGAIHGIHMAIASHSFPAATRRRLRLLVLDGGVGNFRSLPKTPTGCMAVDPIANDAKLKYVGIPLCILGGDDACCGLVGGSSGHFTVLSSAAESLLSENLLPSAAVSSDSALLLGTEGARLNPELYQAVLRALDHARDPADQATEAFVADVLDSPDLNNDVSRMEHIPTADFEQICKDVTGIALQETGRAALWAVRTKQEPQRGQELKHFILAYHAPILKQHRGFKMDEHGFHEFQNVVAVRRASSSSLAEAYAKLQEAFSLEKLDHHVWQLERDRAVSFGVRLGRCHEVLDRALTAWRSRGLLSDALSRSRLRGGSTQQARAVIRELSAEMNLAHAKKLGFRGSATEVDQQMAQMFGFWSSHDLSLSGKLCEVQECVAAFSKTLTNELCRQAAATPRLDAAPTPSTLSASPSALSAALPAPPPAHCETVSAALANATDESVHAATQSSVQSSSIQSADDLGPMPVTVFIDRELGLSSQLMMPLGSSVRRIKEQLAAADPIGALRPADVQLRLPSMGGGGAEGVAGGNNAAEDEFPVAGLCENN
eukprot:CAMPEP_0204212814 /NCGR_PEP_ID=MMETSP0361-20130328/75519_1 /ASSEMBLY_ACC=CAM_ASM_000343 /TAXON_ID=268821 /ORGANISM="Scrippsiella Hangoei, Strain SHTV-5" /LENGTH=1245 /DNA_ID=CAMNT_0051177193 /DNA_START=64 /DNA_END=3802 /DNA_ORIENTATION=-